MKIAIIGAGLSAASCARELQKKGHSVSLWEKSRGRGGRLARKQQEWGQIDLGAQYFTARSPDFIKQTEEWLANKTVAQWKFQPAKATNYGLVASPDDQQRYVGTPSMNAIAHNLAEGLDIQFNQRVHRIVSQPNTKIQLLNTENQVLGEYDMVVCSAPAEQTNALLLGFGIREQIPAGKIHSPCWTLSLATRSNQVIAQDIQGIFGDETISWVSRSSAQPSRVMPKDAHDQWLAHFSPYWSEQHPRDTDINLLETASRWLQRQLHLPHEVCQHYQHYWRYADIYPTVKPSPTGFYFSEHERIGIIGDWCNGGRVEGAYLSGLALAKHVG